MFYDYRMICFCFDELSEICVLGDFCRLFFYVKEGFYGNMGGIGLLVFYWYVCFGIKDLVYEYIEEIVVVIEEVVVVLEDVLFLSEKVYVFE